MCELCAGLTCIPAHIGPALYVQYAISPIEVATICNFTRAQSHIFDIRLNRTSLSLYMYTYIYISNIQSVISNLKMNTKPCEIT